MILIMIVNLPHARPPRRSSPQESFRGKPYPSVTIARYSVAINIIKAKLFNTLCYNAVDNVVDIICFIPRLHHRQLFSKTVGRSDPKTTDWADFRHLNSFNLILI